MASFPVVHFLFDSHCICGLWFVREATLIFVSCKIRLWLLCQQPCPPGLSSEHSYWATSIFSSAYSPRPQVWSVLTSKGICKCQSAETVSGCRPPKHWHPPRQLYIFSAVTSCLTLKSFVCFVIFSKTPPYTSSSPFLVTFLNPNQPPLLSYPLLPPPALIPHFGLCGVSGSGSCWLGVRKVKKRSGGWGGAGG